VKLGGLPDLRAPPPRFVLVNDPGGQISVNGHLLARHRVEREARHHLRRAHRAVVDDEELNRQQDEEDHDADDEVAADDELPEGFNDRPGGVLTRLAVRQNQPRRRHVEREPVERSEQQECREGREFDGLRDVNRREQHDDREHQVEADEHVEQEGRQRHEQHEQHDDRGGGDGEMGETTERGEQLFQVHAAGKILSESARPKWPQRGWTWK
jgi:hypothetical protein